jgi:hypothetical protein
MILEEVKFWLFICTLLWLFVAVPQQLTVMLRTVINDKAYVTSWVDVATGICIIVSLQRFGII